MKRPSSPDLALLVVLALAVASASAGTACSSGSSGGGSGSSGASGSGGGSGSGGASSSGATSSGGDAASGDTWASWGQGFFATYCVECHAASDPTGRDFTKQSIVVANADAIRCGVCVTQDPSWKCPASPPAKQFPISDSTASNPKPTDAERDRVVAWIGAGAP